MQRQFAGNKITDMRVAIACTKKDLNSAVESYFATANWFCICDTQTKEQIFIENPSDEKLTASGCHAAKKLVAQKIEMVIARSFNIKVLGYLRDNNVQMVTPQVNISAAKLIDKVMCF